MTLPGAATAQAFPFDARPLLEPVDAHAARAYARQLRQSGGLPGRFTGATVVIVVFVVIFALVFGSVFLSLFVSIFASLTAGSGTGSIAGALISVLPFLVFGVVIAVVIVGVVVGNRAAAVRMFRLDRFARANGMSYLPALGAHAMPGMIFDVGSSRLASDVVRGERPRLVEFANYQYTTGSGKSKTTHKWGYVAVKLDTPLPHIVLDATSNNGLFGSNLPLSFGKDQRLSLEGDFDRFFTLYCPADYERDALYLFTPDIMARFIDNAAALDVEIVDDWLFLYAKRDFSTLDPQTWAWLFSVVGALLDKFAQWARWRDERLAAAAASSIADAASPGSTALGGVAGQGGAASVPFAAPLAALRPPPGVAPQGRRLQRGVPWVPIIVGGVMLLFWIFTQIGPEFLR
jgi:hypothetical protein